MNTRKSCFQYPAAALSACAALALLAGCAHLDSVGVSGGYNPATQAANGGVVITFRAAPSLPAQHSLVKAGAVKIDDLQWHLAATRSRPENAARRECLRLAFDEGASISNDLPQ